MCSCGFVATFLLWQEIGEINRKLPEDQQISYFWMHVDRFARIKREYKCLYPNGKLHLWGTVFEIAAFIFFFLTIVELRFFK